MAYVHYTARALWGKTPLIHRQICSDLWRRFREEFPRTLGFVLMPDHFHFLLETAQPETVRKKIGRLLSGFTRRHFPGLELWSPVAPPAVIPDLHHLKRNARYVHLNPCRRGLVNDPLAWEWSTHREAIGAAASEWLDKQTLADACRTGMRDFARVFHRYVSADPSVKCEGTPLPKVVSPQQLIAPMSALLQAVSQASRELSDSRTAKRQVVLLGDQMGIQKKNAIALASGLSVRTVQNILSQHRAGEGSRTVAQDRATLSAATVLLSAPDRFGIR